MTRASVIWVALLAIASIQGCTVGYDTVLFATKSNFGVDVDTSPPNFEAAISRQEGVVAPVFELGQTVPIMSSFSAKSNAFTSFFWGVGSTFSTGEAAYTMSYLYKDATPAHGVKIGYTPIKLAKKPDPQLPFGIKPEYLESGTRNVRPVIFGTDTSLGLKVKWSGTGAQYPSAINIGFKRKEVAIAPITITNKEDDKTAFTADTPSLLATIDSDVHVDGKAELAYMQYFATGTAATNLARQQDVREAMLKRSDPLQQIQKQEAVQGKTVRETNRKLIDQIAEIYKSANKDKKTEVIKQAKTFLLVPDCTTESDFTKNLANNSDSSPEKTAKLVDLVQFAAKKIFINRR